MKHSSLLFSFVVSEDLEVILWGRSHGSRILQMNSNGMEGGVVPKALRADQVAEVTDPPASFLKS